MISVVIPLYNKEALIGRTLESVLAQSYHDFEVVVVDDGSRDGSAAVVESFDDPRIRLIRQENAGVSAARNRGIAEVRGEFIALLDADDIWRENYLQTQFELTQKYPQCEVFATDYCFSNSKGVEKATIIRKLPFDGEDGILTNYFEVASCSHPPLWTSAVMVRKGAIESIGGFPVGIKSGEDLITWARLSAKYQIAYSRFVGAVFMENHSSDGESKPKQRFSEKDYVLEQLTILKNNIQDPILKQGLHKYILRWYKIQCVIMLEIKEHPRCFKYSIKAIREGGRIQIFLPLIILSCLPHNICLKIIKRK